MKFKRFFILSILLMAILIIGAVSAEDNLTDDNAILNDASDVPLEDSGISDYNYTVYIPEKSYPARVDAIRVSQMPKNATGNITISIDDVEKYNEKVYVSENSLILTGLDLDWGMHNATVKYSGDSRYAGFTKTGQFEYNYVIFDIPSEVIYGRYLSDHEISIRGAYDVGGQFRVLIDGKLFYEGNSRIADVDLEGLSFATHTYEVSYSNGNYRPVTKKGSFNVSYYFNAAGKSEILYGNPVKFEIDLPYEAQSNVTVALNGKTYSFNQSSIELSDFRLGENTVTFTYEDEHFYRQSIERKVNVLPNLNVPEKADYNSNANITLIMPEDIVGNLSVNGDSYPLTGGRADVSLNNLSVGRYNVTVGFGDIIPKKIYTIEVVPNLEVPEKLWINGDNRIVFSADESFNGNLTLSGFMKDTVRVVNGSAEIPIKKIKAGHNSLKASYENYTWEFDIMAYEESPDWNMTFSYPESIHVGDGAYDWMDTPIYELQGPLVELSGRFDVYRDGEYLFCQEVENQIPSFQIIDPKFGEIAAHNITVVYSGDDYFRAQNVTLTYEVTDFEAYTYARMLYVRTLSSATGTIKVKINGKDFASKKVVDDDEYASKTTYFPLKELELGRDYDFEVDFKSDKGNHNKRFTVNLDYVISVYSFEESHATYGQNNLMEIMLPGETVNKPAVTIDGRQYSCSRQGSGTYHVDIQSLKPGNHSYTVTYPGDDVYPSKSVNGSFEVVCEIQKPYSYAELNEYSSVRLLLPNDAKGNLTVMIKRSGQSEYTLYKSTDRPSSDGWFSVPMPTSELGRYDYIASFNGNYEVEDVSGFIFTSAEWRYKSSMKYGDSQDIAVDIGETPKATVVINAQWEWGWPEPIGEFEIDSKNNRITLDRNLMERAKAIISHSMCDGYSYFQITADVYVDGDKINGIYIFVPLTPKLEAKNLKMLYSDDSTFNARITDIYGNPICEQTVEFSVKSKSYYVDTDSKGIAKLKITGKPQKLKVTAVYKDVTVTKQVEIKHIVTLKSVKVKRSAKKLVLTATLKKVKGKYLNGKKITFKFNGKKFTAKTNKKGVAKVTVKKSVLKKLKKGKKVTYQATYLKDTVKKSVKVRK